MLTVGEKFPESSSRHCQFDVARFPPDHEQTYDGKWLLGFFYPKD